MKDSVCQKRSRIMAFFLLLFHNMISQYLHHVRMSFEYINAHMECAPHKMEALLKSANAMPLHVPRNSHKA